MSTTTSDQITQAARELANGLAGRVILPGDGEYDEARALWNGIIDRRPGVIVRARTAEDVREAVRFATSRALPVSVRGGGHNVAGNAVIDGAVVVDLSEMRGVAVDAAARTVRVEGGAQIGDVDEATQKHGLAVPFGVFPETGVAGLTLGGGLGWLRRRFGLTVDSLLEVEVVTAAGEIVVANERQHSDLFWALRGGGGNFGVVTAFTFQAHEIGTDVLFSAVYLPFDAAREALAFYHDYINTTPDALSSFAILGGLPDDPHAPAEVRGKDFALFLSVWSGDPDEGERVVRPLREFAAPMLDDTGVRPFIEVQHVFDPDYPKGGRYYWKSNYIDGLDAKMIDILVEHAGRRPSPVSTIDVWQLGGAVARVPAEATPIPQRSAAYLIGVESNWFDAGADAENIAWARELYRAVVDASPGGLYVNFAGFGEEADELTRRAYGANYARLARVKAAYDPANVFRFNTNIKPAATAESTTG